MSGNSREALPEFREYLVGSPGCPGWSKGLPGCPGVIGRPSQMIGSGQEALPDVRE